MHVAQFGPSCRTEYVFTYASLMTASLTAVLENLVKCIRTLHLCLFFSHGSIRLYLWQLKWPERILIWFIPLLY